MSEFVSLLELINYGFVLFFGIVMSLYLADIHFEDNKIPYIITILALGAIQLLSYLMMGENLLYKCYPLLIHLPLVSPDPFCLSPEYLYRDDLCAVRLPDVHSQKMVRHAGSLLFRRQSGCSQSRLYLRDDSAAVSGHPLYCALYHPSAL